MIELTIEAKDGRKPMAFDWRSGVGSDHADRALEIIGITLSEQLCAKPVSVTVWRWDEVAAHWDDLIMRSTLPRSGEADQALPRSRETIRKGRSADCAVRTICSRCTNSARARSPTER